MDARKLQDVPARPRLLDVESGARWTAQAR